MNEKGANRLARPSVSSRKTRFLVVVLAVAAVMAAACSGSEPSQVSTQPAAPPADPAPAPASGDPANDLPEVTVVNVVSGESLVLSSLAPADRPILAWFWAPH
ncbi:MAG: hypothetical protein J4F44_07650 [Acidimicrobiia bacterium]|nr:hypothetical protein [Acidimicrobiia bacterium]